MAANDAHSDAFHALCRRSESVPAVVGVDRSLPVVTNGSGWVRITGLSGRLGGAGFGLRTTAMVMSRGIRSPLEALVATRHVATSGQVMTKGTGCTCCLENIAI